MGRTKKFLVLIIAVAIVFTLVNLVTGWTAVDPGYDLEFARSDRGILPEFVEGNTPGTVDGLIVFKQDYGSGGFHLNGETEPVLFTFYPDPEDNTKVFRVWLAYHEGDGKTYVYRWETDNIAVHYFMVKGGENFFVYTYNETFDYDGHLISPRVGVNDQNIADISHIDLVFEPAPEETTTTEATTTTTGPEDETVTETTTTEATTTTTEPEDETQTQTTATTTILDEEIPQTGESGNDGLLIGLILLGLAGSLTILLHRSQKKNHQ